jgi:hypothetical protein
VTRKDMTVENMTLQEFIEGIQMMEAMEDRDCSTEHAKNIIKQLEAAGEEIVKECKGILWLVYKNHNLLEMLDDPNSTDADMDAAIAEIQAGFKEVFGVDIPGPFDAEFQLFGLDRVRREVEVKKAKKDFDAWQRRKNIPSTTST